MGKNLYERPRRRDPDHHNPDSDGAGRIAQGSLEAANVNVVEEMVNDRTQRAYESIRAISSVDSMLRSPESLRGLLMRLFNINSILFDGFAAQKVAGQSPEYAPIRPPAGGVICPDGSIFSRAN